MNKLTICALATFAAPSSAFAPLSAYGPLKATTTLRVATSSVAPFVIDVAEDPTVDVTAMPVATTASVETEMKTIAKKALPKKKKAPAAGAHKEGIFTPVVKASKVILGDQKLNKVRAKAIATHSDVIGTFVQTSDTSFGQTVLTRLFALSDKDGDGTIDKEELRLAFESLGFDWLKDKQITGIFKRADKDGNGVIDMDEWKAEAPKTLRTNLIKLAKKNGGELGFLS